jgi:hypothetical protein
MTRMLRSLQMRSRGSVRTAVTRSVVVIALIVTLGVVSAAVSRPSDAVASPTPILGAGGEFHPLPPARILDTRSGLNDIDKAGIKTISRGQGADRSNVFDVQVLGQGGLPVDIGQVLAVAVNVAVVQPTTRGHARAFASGATETISALVNFAPGETVPNASVVSVGDNGKLSVRIVGSPGTAHVVIDVFGFFSKSSYPQRGARLLPVDPTRRYDSRDTNRPLGRDGQVALPMRGRNGVPLSADVVGVLVNVTGVNNLPRSAQTFVSALPAPPPPGQRPRTSNLNLPPGRIKPNTVLAPIGADGTLHLFNANGEVHVVVDVLGYLIRNRPLESRAGRVVPLAAPFRVFDTREAAFGAQPLAPGKGEDWSFAAFANDVRIPTTTGLTAPAGRQSALLGNFTATGLQRPPGWLTPVSTFLAAYPTPPDRAIGPPPLVANLNLTEGVSVPNLTLMRYGGPSNEACGQATRAQIDAQICQVRVYNHNGFVHYVFDATAVVLAD